MEIQLSSNKAKHRPLASQLFQISTRYKRDVYPKSLLQCRKKQIHIMSFVCSEIIKAMGYCAIVLRVKIFNKTCLMVILSVLQLGVCWSKQNTR